VLKFAIICTQLFIKVVVAAGMCLSISRGIMNKFQGLSFKIKVSATALLAVLGLLACSDATTSIDGSPDSSISTAATSTAGVLCNYAESVFNSSASVNAISTASWSCSDAKRNLSANGLPDHAVGNFPNENNPNTITSQSVIASLNLSPSYFGYPTTMGGPQGATGYILNGVKIDAATGGTCNDTGSTCSANGNVGSWNIEAVNSGYSFGVDSNNAHVQPGGTYHYHGMPEGFIAKLGKGAAMTLIGWAADGFPIYARYGYATATNAASSIKVMTSSYRLKSSIPSNRAPISQYKLGTFQQDYEYVAGLGDLDECNGRFGVTPEFPSGTYHYFATDTYPFLQRCVKGKV
jgi:YHYH protein